MGNFSAWWEDSILNHIFDQYEYTPPYIYVALFQNGSEVSGLGYARFGTIYLDWNEAFSGMIDNGVDFVFPKATGDWGTITHFALYDAATSGHQLMYGVLSSPKEILTDNRARFKAGDIVITLD